MLIHPFHKMHVLPFKLLHKSGEAPPCFGSEREIPLGTLTYNTTHPRLQVLHHRMFQK